MANDKDARQAARQDLLKRIQNLEIARQCMDHNLMRLRQELNEIHQHTLELGRVHHRTHTPTGRHRRLDVANEDDFMQNLDESNIEE
jgi:hypothetical protein